jgi:ornithine carbamoyltransferase
MGRGETISDTALVLNKYVDCIIGRVNKHEDLEEMAKYAKIPIINALSNLYHPCQIVSDLYTIKEKFGKLEGLKLAYIGDGNNVCNSLLIGCSLMGLDISVACPAGYSPPKEIVNSAILNAKINGKKVLTFRDPIKAVRKANIVYTDTFISMGNESQREKRLKDFLPDYQITTSLIKKAAKKAVFMHCLPAHRGEEVVTEVIDGPNSIVWDQAENRLHTSKAILEMILSTD